MKKKSASRMIWMLLAGVAIFAFQLPSIIYGEPPETIEILQPRFTPTSTPPEMELTQRAFALMFFTPTYTPEPTQPFLAFLFPITGRTETLTPTASITNTATLSATPTRTLQPIFQTQTRVNEGGGGGGGAGTFTSTPFRTSTPVINPSLAASFTPVLTATDGLPPTSTVEQATETLAPTDTPTRLPNTHRPPTHTLEPNTNTPAPPPTGTSEPPTNPPDPTETVESLPANDSITVASAPSLNLMQFILMYLLGATFLGVVFRRR